MHTFDLPAYPAAAPTLLALADSHPLQGVPGPSRCEMLVFGDRSGVEVKTRLWLDGATWCHLRAQAEKAVLVGDEGDTDARWGLDVPLPAQEGDLSCWLAYIIRCSGSCTLPLLHCVEPACFVFEPAPSTL